MKKRKLKFFVMPMIYGLMCATIILTFLVFYKTDKQEPDNYTYVNSSIISKSIPTISETSADVTIIKPYTSEKVSVYKKFYSKEQTDLERENSILFFNNTYVQNTGTLFKSDEVFDVVSIMDGTVLNIKKDETLGNVIEVKHENNIVSSYYGINNIKVAKNSKIKQGDVLGTSGKINIDSLENALLIELTKDGTLVNPENYFGKKLNEI